MKHVYHNVLQLIESIELLMEEQFISSVLILTYSAIDIVSSLSVKGDRDAQRRDFIEWVDKYLLPIPQTSCTGKDLYAARCSVIHILGSESLLSRKGEAKNIVYTWGNESVEKLQKNMNLIETPTIVIKIEVLIQSFREAVADFFEAAKDDRELWETIKKRSQKMFSNENFSDEISTV